MKKLFLTIIILMLLFPTLVLAKSKVPVYFFHGDGCPHCEEADNFFNNLDKETKDKIEIKKYEVWYDEDNSKMMDIVSNIRNDNVMGVPYIIIGDKDFQGYTESMDDRIIDQINEVYNEDDEDRYDVLKEYEEHKDEYLNDYYDEDDDYIDSDVIIDPVEPSNYFAATGIILFLAIFFGIQLVIGIIILIIFLAKRKK